MKTITERIKERQMVAKKAEDEQWEELVRIAIPYTKGSILLKNTVLCIIEIIIDKCVDQNSIEIDFDMSTPKVEDVFIDTWPNLSMYSFAIKKRFILESMENIFHELSRQDPKLMVFICRDEWKILIKW